MQNNSLTTLSRNLRDAITLSDQSLISANLILIIRHFISNQDLESAESMLNAVTIDHSRISPSHSSKIFYYKSLVNAFREEYGEALEFCKFAINSLPPIEEQSGNVIYYTLLLLNLKAILTVAHDLTVVPIDEIFSEPYLELMAAINFSNEESLHKVTKQHEKRFKEDNLMFLVERTPDFLQKLKDTRMNFSSLQTGPCYNSEDVAVELMTKSKSIMKLFNELEISFKSKTPKIIAASSSTDSDDDLDDTFIEE